MSDSKPQSPHRPPAANSNLLDFTPVPRKVKRPDGWTPERQRRFIELLAETGSPHRAAMAMNKVLSGIEAVYREPGADSFRAAWDHALEIARTRERSDLVQKSDGPAVDPPHRRASVAEPDPEDEEEEDPERSLELIGLLFAKFMLNVERERACRLQGEVVAADFHLRQITCFEVSMDLMIAGHGMDSWEAMMRIRRDGRGVLEIGDTLMSRMLDDARRQQWAKMGEPTRPEHPPERYLTDHGTYRTEDLQCLGKASTALPGVDPAEWAQLDTSEQRRLEDEQHRRDAAAQIEWETAARREYEERRDRDASS